MNHPRIRIIRNLRWLGGVWLGAALWTWGGPALAQDFNVETSAVVQKQVRDTLTPFASQAELDAFLKEYQVASLKDEKQIERYNKKYGSPTAAPLAMSRSGDSITNVQHAGVDEGDIVKLHGDHLVVLSRGRLFSVGLAQNTLKPIDAINAYAPDIDPKGTWYDEMLISGDTIAVVSYSYDRGGTEIGLFNVDSAGKLSYRETYHLRSNDYYSSRNYASRLVGSKLIFYTPSRLSDEDPFQSLPALRQWRAGASPTEFKPIYSATRVYRPLLTDIDITLHTVTSCDLAKRQPECSSTVVMGGASRNFYVSPDAVYVWLTRAPQSGKGERFLPGLLYRMPFDGSEPGVLRVAGGPIDPFSFLEKDGFLNVLASAQSDGDQMWSPEFIRGDLAMLRVPLSAFSTAASPVKAGQYTVLPKPAGSRVQNRFVGNVLLYGNASSAYWEKRSDINLLHAFHVAKSEAPQSLLLPHPADRIDALGDDAVVIGNAQNNIYFTPIDLGAKPRVAPSYVQPDASEGETRSHGFFYKARNRHSGILGLPIRERGKPAGLLFLKNQNLRFEKAGQLSASADGRAEDHCIASCVDWYGNSRPIFIRDRVIALLGYELVEGDFMRGKIAEQQRSNMLSILKLASGSSPDKKK